MQSRKGLNGRVCISFLICSALNMTAIWAAEGGFQRQLRLSGRPGTTPPWSVSENSHFSRGAHPPPGAAVGALADRGCTLQANQAAFLLADTFLFFAARCHEGHARRVR